MAAAEQITKAQNVPTDKDNVSLYDLLRSSYKDKDHISKIESRGYNYLKDYSNEKNSVFYNKDKKHVLFGVAGTNPRDMNDLKTDFALVVGALKSTNRYKSSLDIAQKIESELQYDKMHLAGHSLGGAIVTNLAKEGIFKDRNKVVPITYNKAKLPFEARAQGEIEKRSNGDIISIFERSSSNLDTNYSFFTPIQNHNLEHLAEDGNMILDHQVDSL